MSHEERLRRENGDASLGSLPHERTQIYDSERPRSAAQAEVERRRYERHHLPGDLTDPRNSTSPVD